MRKILSVMAFVSMIGIAGASFAEDPDRTESMAFNSLDTNKDGTLSKVEAANAKGLDFAKADTNKDGKLSRSEYEAAVS